MRTGIILGREHGSKSFEMISGPGDPIAEQNQAIRKLLACSGVNDDFEEVQFWTSDGGLQRRLRFKTTKQVKAEAAERERQEKARLERQSKAPAPKEAKWTSRANTPAADRSRSAPRDPL